MSTTGNDQGKIVIYIGPMFSGKTESIIEKYDPEALTTAVKPDIDTRSPSTLIKSHSKKTIPAYTVKNLRDIEGIVKLVPGQRLLVDEGQFFSDLVSTSVHFARMGMKVYIAALNGTFDQKPWPVISKIIPKADKIVHLRAKCQHCGRPNSASFTVLKRQPDQRQPADDGRVLIGGGETYESICGKCLRVTKEES